MVFENIKATFLEGLTLVGSISRKEGFDQIGVKISFKDVGVTALSL
jgi:hypothetical protein